MTKSSPDAEKSTASGDVFILEQSGVYVQAFLAKTVKKAAGKTNCPSLC